MANFVHSFGVLCAISLVSVSALPVQEHETRQEVSDTRPVEGEYPQQRQISQNTEEAQALSAGYSGTQKFCNVFWFYLSQGCKEEIRTRRTNRAGFSVRLCVKMGREQVLQRLRPQAQDIQERKNFAMVLGLVYHRTAERKFGPEGRIGRDPA